MLYEIATLTVRLGGMPATLDALKSIDQLGVWTTEIGELNNVIILRAFDGLEALAADRKQQRSAATPFNAGDTVSAVSYDTYTAFPFVTPLSPGKYGSIYEIRTYRLKPGGVDPTLAAWEIALVERTKLSPIAFAGVAIDGPPRFTHIWPFASLNDRGAIRADAVARGIWPPKGGPNWLTGDMRSTIGLPTAFSNLA